MEDLQIRIRPDIMAQHSKPHLDAELNARVICQDDRENSGVGAVECAQDAGAGTQTARCFVVLQTALRLHARRLKGWNNPEEEQSRTLKDAAIPNGCERKAKRITEIHETQIQPNTQLEHRASSFSQILADKIPERRTQCVCESLLVVALPSPPHYLTAGSRSISTKSSGG